MKIVFVNVIALHIVEYNVYSHNNNDDNAIN